MSPPKTIIVTGANRGIGRAICTLLLADTSLSGVHLFATSRRGEPLGFAVRDAATQHVVYPALDLEQPDSIRAFAARVRRETGGVDVLINNAGINLDLSGAEPLAAARKTMRVNYRGTREMCEQLLPLLAPGAGRIVNMSSIASQLRGYSAGVRERFRRSDLSLEEIDALVEEYMASLQPSSPMAGAFGPPNRAYNVSKACVNATTRALARANPGLAVNCCCPGWVLTDMGALVGKAPKTPEQGARIPLRLALGDLGGYSGRYWANESVRGKGEGQVMDWGPDGAFVAVD